MALFKYPYTDFHELNIDWVIKAMKELQENVEALDNWKSQFEEDFEKFEEWMAIIESGELPPAMQAGLLAWAEEHLQDLVGATIPAVFFGINDEGYFYATIPSGWSDLHFGTSGLDDFPAGVDYGHLTISY